MSRGRFVLKQIHVRGAGTSDLTRYVAKSKLDEEREGRKPRELFTRTADNLTHRAAKEWLSITGGALKKGMFCTMLSRSSRRANTRFLGTMRMSESNKSSPSFAAL